MAMNSSSKGLSLLEILKETFKLTRKNKKMSLHIALSAAILLLLLSMASILFNLSPTEKVTAEVMSLFTMDSKSTPEYRNTLLKIKEDAIVFIVVTIVLQLVALAFSLCATVAITYTSAMSYLGKDLTLMDIYSNLTKIWLRSSITFFWSCLVSGGYFLMLLPIVLILSLGKDIMIIVGVGAVLFLAAQIINSYLSSLLALGLVSLILEDCCGLQALGKGQKLLEGRKTIGVVLGFIISILASPVYLVTLLTNNQYQAANQLLITYTVMTFLVLVTMVNLLVYTVFYFECKKGNGEEAEIHKVMNVGEYKRVSAVPMDDSDFACN